MCLHQIQAQSKLPLGLEDEVNDVHHCNSRASSPTIREVSDATKDDGMGTADVRRQGSYIQWLSSKIPYRGTERITDDPAALRTPQGILQQKSNARAAVAPGPRNRAPTTVITNQTLDLATILILVLRQHRWERDHVALNLFNQET
jgi:hypothetical protein